MKTRSIAFRLISAVLLVELVSAIIVVFLALGYERHAHFRAFDVMLHGRADSVLGAVEDADDAADNVMLNQADLHVPPEDIYEVDEGSRLLGRSANWPGPTAVDMEKTRGGMARLDWHHHHYALLTVNGSRVVDPGEAGGKRHDVTIYYGAPTEPVWHAINGAVEFYAVGSLLLLLVTGPLIAWLLHRGLLPLRELASLAGQVSVNSWAFSPPESARLTPELAPLTQAIENVLDRLQQSFAKERAFVSDAAHELKTGVAVVKSSLQVVAMKRRTAEDYEAGLNRCLADTRRIEEIVAKMLTLAREESAAQPAGRQPVTDLAECLRVSTAQLENMAALAQVKLVATIPGTAAFAVAVAADECSMLISNLLSNAIQHSLPGSEVQARLTLEGNSITLTIEDTGEGIDPEALPHVFDRFYRGDPSRTRSTGGTGLGLAICKAIAERAGGSISIASQPGKGTTVTVFMPLATSSAAKQNPPSV